MKDVCILTEPSNFNISDWFRDNPGKHMTFYCRDGLVYAFSSSVKGDLYVASRFLKDGDKIISKKDERMWGEKGVRS